MYEKYHYKPVALKGQRQHRHLLHRAHVAEEHWTGDQLATEIFQGAMIINGLSFDNENSTVPYKQLLFHKIISPFKQTYLKGGK